MTFPVILSCFIILSGAKKTFVFLLVASGSSDSSGAPVDSHMNVESRLLIEYCQSRAILVEIYDKLAKLQKNKPAEDQVCFGSTNKLVSPKWECFFVCHLLLGQPVVLDRGHGH